MSRTRSAPSRSVQPAIAMSGPSAAELTQRYALAALASLVVVATLAPADALPREGLGVMVAAGALVVLAGWLLAAFFTSGGKQGILVVAGRIEAAMAAVLVFVTASALVMASQGNARATINALWYWVSFGAVFFLGRQLISGDVQRRAVVAGMLGLTTGLALYGGHQYFIELPAMRAEYLRDPEKALRLAGIDAPPGTPLRKQFEDRVLQSVEPIGTFALTNSLAGVLAPWWIVAAGVGLAALRYSATANPRGKWLTVATAALCALAMGACLLLTKSRSAWLAALIGGIIVAAAIVRSTRLPRAKVVVGLGVAVVIWAALVVGAMQVGALDAKILSEAAKSVAYRFEYWKAAAAIAGAMPVFGCGPGNFQEYYAFYKAPQSSETVGDPHNFLLEIWATCGSPAVVAFLVLMALGAAMIWRQGAAAGSEAPEADASEEAGPGASPNLVIGGMLLGLALTFVHNLLLGRQLSFAAVGYCSLAMIGVWLGLRWWIRSGALPTSVMVAALVALLVNLCAAGGVSFPNVAIGGWLLFALAAPAIELRPSSGVGKLARRRISRGASALAVLGGLALLGALVFTAYRPLLESRALLDRAERSTGIDDQIALLERAAAADRYSPEPYRRLAALHARRYEASGDDRDRRAFRLAVRELFEKDKQSNSVRQMAGDLNVNVWRKSGDDRDLANAIDAYRAATKLYPASSFLHAELALALDLSGDRQAARDEANEALRLDSLNPHRELELSRRYLHDGLPVSGDGPAGVLAEPFLRRLRTAR